MTKFKLNGFIALLTVAAGVALWGAGTGRLAVEGESVGVDAIPDIIATGLGGQLAHRLILIGLSAMIGRFIGYAGAAQRNALKIIDVVGGKNVEWTTIGTSVPIGNMM